MAQRDRGVASPPFHVHRDRDAGQIIADRKTEVDSKLMTGAVFSAPGMLGLIEMLVIGKI